MLSQGPAPEFVVQLTDELQLDKQMKHTIDVVIDRLIAGKSARARVAEAIESALNLAERRLVVSGGAPHCRRD